METRGVLLEMLEEVSCVHLVKKCGTILELVDVDFFNRSTDEFLATVFGCLPETIVFSTSLVHGFGFFQFHHSRIFVDLVVPQAKALRDRKFGSAVVSLIGCVGLDDSDDMVDSIRSVVGNGLEYVEELLFQRKKVIIVWLANDGWLSVKSILEKLRDIRWGTHSFFLGAYRWPKSTKMMASKTKAFAIASWAFSSAMETFVNPMADATAEMHFTVKAVSSSNFNSIG